MATVELVILLIVGIWLFGKFFSDEVTKATDPTTIARTAVERKLEAEGLARPGAGETDSDVKQVLPRTETSVLVLNGNGVSGAASKTARKVLRKDYLVVGTENASRDDYPRSLVMFRPGYEAEARRLARYLSIRRVVPLDGMRPRELRGAHVALIIGD